MCKANELKPHRRRMFKLSNDPQFVEKLTDGVGLYLNPPNMLSCSARMKKPDSGDRPHPEEPANLSWALRHDDARLQTLWNDNAVSRRLKWPRGD